MRKIGYGLVGILFGIIVYLLMLTNIPATAEVRSTVTDFDKPDNYEQYVADDYFGGDIIPFNEYGSYHVSSVDFKEYERKGIVNYGKVNPMFYFLKKNPVANPENGDGTTDGSKPGEVKPGENKPGEVKPGEPSVPVVVPGKGSESNQPSLTPQEDGSVTYKGFNIKTREEESKDVTNILKSFKQYGRLPIENEYYNISSEFGKRLDPFTNVAAYHTGLDIAQVGIDGTNVYSAIPGEVVLVDSDPEGYGYYVVVKHNGFETLYAHMKAKSTLKVGDKVVAGSILGQIGSTGRSTGPHLHFEVIMDDVRFNPVPFINSFREVD